MGLSYRTDEEVEQWKQRDPIKLMEERLAEQDILSAEAAQAIHDEVKQLIDEAVEFAKSSPMPEPSALLEDVYA